MTTKIVLKPPILQVDIWVKQGADCPVNLTGLVDATGAPITDPTGYIITAQIRAQPNGPALFTWTSAHISYNAQTQISTLALNITAAQTALFTFDSAVWDCFLQNPASQVACIAEGTVTVDQRVTQ